MSFDKEKEQLILALDLARIGFYDWNVPDNCIVYNKYMLEDWGIDSGIGMTLEDAISHIHPEDQDRVRKLVSDAIEKRIPYSTEYRVIRPDGSVAWMDVNGIVQFDDFNRPVRFFGTSLNITDRKQKALILEESEAMIRTFADTMPQMAFIADKTGAITYFNKRWYDYISTDGTEGWGWKDRPVHHPDDLARTIKTWKHSIATGETYEIDYRLRRHDGEYRWHLGRAVPHRNKQGEIIRWCGTNTDIHEERMNLERNRILYDFSRTLSKGMSPKEIAESILNEGRKILNTIGGIVIQRQNDHFKISATSDVPKEYIQDQFYLNAETRLPAKAALFERRSFYIQNQAELLSEFPAYGEVLKHINAKAVVALPLKIQGKAIASVAYFLKEETTYSVELKRFFESLASLAAVAFDRALLFEKQKIQRDELEDALYARDEFFSIASHELKTPLTSMRLNGQFLVKMHERNKDFLTAEKILNYIHQNDRGVSKLVRLVDDMLDISRIRTGRMALRKEQFEICELVHELINRLRETSESEIVIELCESSASNWDKLRIEQVVTNLMSNAIRYGNNQPIIVNVQNKQSHILLSVRDHGIGIPEDILESIFDRYERGPSGDIQGLGLGLYISKQIVDSHGGRIWAESLLGEGSTFYVELPFCPN